MNNGSIKKIRFDTSIFKHIPSETTEGDRKSILAIQEALRAKKKKYVYLEIGSYKGGSLQPFLVDQRCIKIYSLDSRDITALDERGETDFYIRNTEENMFKNLNKYYKSSVPKVVSINKKSHNVSPSEILEKVDIFFIDAEHIDEMVYKDFSFCLKVASKYAVIMFHDVNMIVNAFNKSCTYLDEKGLSFNAYILPSTIGIIELGGLELYNYPKVLERLRNSYEAYVFGMKRMAIYRDMYKKFFKNPIFSLFIRSAARFSTRDLAQK